MEKTKILRFEVHDLWLFIQDDESHDILLKMDISGVDRDKLADVVSDVVRHHFFVWCP